jgi:hypothetical protein
MLARRAGDRDATVGLGLREMKPVGAAREHRRKGQTREEPPLVGLADVRDEIRLDASRLAHELGEPTEQLVIRNGLQVSTGFGPHDSNI